MNDSSSVQNRWLLLFLAIALLWMPHCARKDVDRKGRLKMRGEKRVSLTRKDTGDLLQKGIASWYGKKYHGRKTANGETYDMWAMTAAHKSLPFGTVVRVVNKDNGRHIKVRINDRGPFVKGRVLDLSRKAARELGMEGTGTAKVALYLASGETRGAQDRTSRRSPARSEPRPSRDKPQAQGGYWAVQAGSFADVDRARAMASQVRALETFVAIEKVGGMHRVRVGQFSEKAEANALAADLKAMDIDVWVVFVR